MAAGSSPKSAAASAVLSQFARLGVRIEVMIPCGDAMHVLGPTNQLDVGGEAAQEAQDAVG